MNLPNPSGKSLSQRKTVISANVGSVRRSELHSSSSKSSPDTDLEQVFLQRLNEENCEALIPAPLLNNGDSAVEMHDDAHTTAEEEQEFEFRLFATSAANNPVSRIRVGSPDPTDRPPGLVVPHRPNSYYFANEPNANAKARLASVAVSGSEVRLRSRIPWPGCFLPWRVVNITTSGKVLASLNKHVAYESSEGISQRRSRKGKKARIATRKRVAAEKERLRDEAMRKEDKEIQEKIKRAKRNREKKVKQRERNRRKKAQAAGSPTLKNDENLNSDSEEA